MPFPMKSLRLAAAAALAAWLASGCESMLPSEFRDRSGVRPGSPDGRACALLAGPDSTALPVRAAALAPSALAAWTASPDPGLGGLLDTLAADTLVRVFNPSGGDTVYALFLPEPGADAVFFTSWDLDASNVDAVVEIALIGRDGGVLAPASTAMPLATAAALTGAFEASGQTVTFPDVRGRFVFRPGTEPHLVRFILSEPEAVEPFRVAALAGH
jgi:hypothetical protein